MNRLINELKLMSTHLKVDDLALPVIEDVRFQYWTASGSPQSHHYGDGGLIKHTVEVINLCLNAHHILSPKVDERLLFLAALYHDYGKIYDYEKIDDVWTNSDYKYHVHHVVKSAMMWDDAARNVLSKDEFVSVLHAILAHHGLLEWGSPVTPQSQMAWILHCADNMSAKVGTPKYLTE